MKETDHLPWTRNGCFCTTQWNVILTAAEADPKAAEAALTEFCQTYWYPVYAYIRRYGHGREEAKDLTQELFARLLEKNTLAAASAERGRFRAFLLTCAQNFLRNEYRRKQALKRGGGAVVIAWDDLQAENRYAQEPSYGLDPERLYERRWATTLLENTLAHLKQEYLKSNKRLQFEVLEEFLSGAKSASASYTEAARKLGISEAAVRQAAHRLRDRFAKLLRIQVRDTLNAPEQVDEELTHVLAVLST